MRLKIAQIQKVVAEEFNLLPADLRSTRRPRHISRPRMIAMCLCRKFTHCSYSVLGRHFGAKHHTSVMYAVRRAEQLIESDEHIFSAYGRIAERLSIALTEKLDKRPVLERIKDVERKVDELIACQGKQPGPEHLTV